MKRKTKFTKRLLGILLCITMSAVSLPGFTLAVSAEDTALSDDIVILYTNDIHTYINGTLSYDVISAIKDDLQKEYKYVILADAGDHIQGTAYGSMDKGESIIKLMNAADYDVATLGNHEFDYNMQGCINAIDYAEFPYISCNFYHESDGVRGENVLDSYVMFDCGDEKVAFVGITTPETFSKSTPAYFQDENGDFIYGISGGEDGSELQQDVQKAIDEAEDDGATTVIALGHLGVDSSSSPWTSEETIAEVSGLDAFIDGHSHTVMESKEIKDKDGNDVLLTQTGEYFNRIGIMVIDSESGDITTDFIELNGNETDGYTLTSDLYSSTTLVSDTAVKEMKDNWLKEIDQKLGQKIGSTTVTFNNYDSNGNRLVRSQETNSGDLAADSLYYLFDNMDLDVDIAIMNGGGVRNQAITGDITYKTCKDILPFGNVACLQTVTGQQILDMLEWGARNAGTAENGSFLHVSGITYKINTSVADTTKSDDMDIWTGGPDEYRVYDVMVYNKDTNKWDALVLDAEYNLAGYNYILRDLGGGFAMLDGAVNVLDYVMEDYMVLANYIQAFKDGIVEADNSPLLEKYPELLIDYSNVNGSGRITLTTSDSEPVEEPGRIYVGGIRATEDNADDVLGDADGEAATVTYDAKTNTITLKDAAITDGVLYNDDCMAGICSVGDLNIVLEGRNSITVPDTLRYSIGIYVIGDLSVSGDGILTVAGGNVTAVATADRTYFGSTGITVDGLLTIRTAEVNAVAGNVTVIGGIDDERNIENVGISYGVCTNNGLLLDDGVTLTAMGGDVDVNTVNDDYASSIGINIYNGDIDVYDAVLITGGGKSVSSRLASSYGTVTIESSINIYENSSEVKATGGVAEAPEETAANGVCVYAGNLLIKAGNVTVIGGERTGVVGDAHAVYIEGITLDDGSILGGNMYVECDKVVSGSTYEIIGTTVNMISSDGEAIYAKQGLKISDILTISEPADGKIRQIETDNDVRYTVVNENGNAAQNVTICPLTYYVTINGLSYEMAAEVPAGQSVNEFYCAEDDMGDFSERLPIEKEGYIFDGFYTDESCTDGKEYSFDEPVNADVTIYPKWTKINDNSEPSDSTQTDDTENDDSKPSDSIQTGDNSNQVLWIVILFVSSAGIFGMSIFSKRKSDLKKIK